MLEIYPFTKMSWKSKEIEDKWEPLRRRINTTVHYAEYESVKQGIRPCDVYDFGPNNIMYRLKKVGLDGLHFLPILVSQQYGGYGHRHYTTDNFTDNTFIYGGISKHVSHAITFHDAGVVDVKQRIRKDYESRPLVIGNETLYMKLDGIDHNVTGALLGYPKCDRDFFEKTWLKEGCLDPMYETAENTKNATTKEENIIEVTGSPWLNRLIRYWGFNLIPFFPHSFDCPFAEIFAKKWWKLMEECDPEAAQACYEALNMPMVWSMNNCITTIDHPLFWGSANGYYRPDKVTVKWFPE